MRTPNEIKKKTTEKPGASKHRSGVLSALRTTNVHSGPEGNVHLTRYLNVMFFTILNIDIQKNKTKFKTVFPILRNQYFAIEVYRHAPESMIRDITIHVLIMNN